MAGRLIVVSGPSGSGKSSIVRRLLDELDLEFSVSATTREPRPGEADGVHYHFVSESDFEALIEEDLLLEWAVYNGNYYGTLAEPVRVANQEGRDVLLEIEIQGARQVRAHRPDALMFFVAAPSLEALKERLSGRGDTSVSDIDERLGIAESEMAEAPELFDHIVLNDVLEGATEQIANLISRSR